MPFDPTTAQPVDGGGFDPSTAVPDRPPKKTAKAGLSALAEPVASVASSAVAYPAGVAAGFGGLTLEGVRRAGLPIEERDPLKIQQDVRRMLTYQPRSQAGQSLLAPLQWMSEQLGGAAAGARDLVAPPKTSGPLQSAIGTGVEEGVKQLPTFLGAAAPKIAGAVSKGLRSGAERTMQSALKPSLKELQTGKGAQAINTLLEEGINVSKGGLQTLRDRVNSLNADIAQRLTNSPVMLNGPVVLSRIRGEVNNLLDKFTKQASHTTDLAAIQKAWDEVLNHPLLQGDVPILTAQEIKQGTYRSVGERNYPGGPTPQGGVSTEKAVARVLKEEIAKAAPEVRPLNAEESKLLTALKPVERRVLMAANRNLAGMGWLTRSAKEFAGFMADRSELFKSLVARMLNTGSQMAPPVGAAGPLGGVALTGQANQILPPPQ